ncbi:sulfonate ABC transporter substrate-binding protein [Embleya scabrispora]|uniref:Sulfonate ABC transporter substrate-binding protein n=1 Tax=Embleya scabrispora TaxID=159449 RepID=A0A1T3P476_9ACTN|nr:ABC transporter substrate-binding protein [Embleya scabrispora]OPC83897.1 sulfonate ABC transporter substrate-binding protein [Embleya scabrispora]
MTVTIGVHGSNPSLYLLARLGILERALEPLGETVTWLPVEGTRVGELLGTGTIDFGGTGSTPPIVGQAQGHDIVYVAVSAPRPAHGALLVADEGPVRTAVDLKGGTVVLSIGSWQTHFVAKALNDVGLSYRDDITPVRPAAGQDQAARLRAGEIAGWVAQGPELAAARRESGLRVLHRVGDVITDRSVFFARRAFAEERSEVVATVVAALREADAWAVAHPEEAAELHAAELPGTRADWAEALAALPWRLEPVPASFIAEQQEAADIFVANGFIDRPITVADAQAAALSAPVARVLAAAEGAGR